MSDKTSNGNSANDRLGTVSSKSQYVVQKILERGKQPACTICKSKFGLLTREHKCKRCYRSICSNHVGGTRAIPSYTEDPLNPHKVCQFCFSECDKLDTMINKVFNMKFGYDNKVSDTWFNSLKLDNN
jgi:hypothetical protein